ncbi:MAG: D-aminoacylase [Acidobacteria bacterium]|nr:D-aminoacylase [Acidobacteriota bacterium]
MIRRRNTLLIALTLAIAALGGWHLSAQGPAYDVLIRGGQIVDGTGNPFFYGDVALKGGRIAAVGRLPNATATRVIDATGLVVAPGFIDMHTHSDGALVEDGTAQSKVRQGVTLDILGEGGSVAPRDGLKAEGNEDWTTLTGYFAKVEKQGISMNAASYVSEGQVRRVVMGYDSGPASPAQLEQMKKLVARTLDEGAIGLMGRFESGGPPYPNEVIELAKVAARYGVHYASHIGSEGYEQQKELDFAIRLAEETKMPVHILHFKIRGQKIWDRMPGFVKQVQAARDRGLDITANVYPYTAMSHGWGANFPLWMREGGPDKFAERLRQAQKDPALREKLKKDPDFIAWCEEHGWWEGIAMARARTPRNKEYEGMRVAQIAKIRGNADPADTLINLMAEDGGGISGVFHNQSEENVRLVLSQPWVAPASDGSAINLEASGVPHPRNYGTNVRVLGKYVREDKLLGMEDAVRKMTSLPAQVLGLRDRGQLREGFVADVVVFDPKTVKDTNSYEKPKSYATGVPYVLVNGVVVIDKGEHNGARPGKGIRGPGYKAPKATSSSPQ